ncbi:MAG: SGNH/GDSL hydrolase family protein [Oscillospiraceae bacterium]|nr:SGNH/GDSL hydrolase family protein [Oscillospiraceae bacterium]
MKSKIRFIPGMIAAVMCFSLAGCNKSGDIPADTAAEESTQITELADVQEVSEEPFVLENGITDAMYKRALISEGNKSRLAKAMLKAQNEKQITVGVIGGSITQGSLASNQANCYAELFHAYWTEKFPDCEVNFVNAGIGGTNSYLGVHRVDEQLLSAKPDVVITEFAVNDTDKVMNKYSYDSLVRKILSSESEPAVILLFTASTDGNNLQEVHKEIGAAYDLPMISYRDAFYPEIEAGNIVSKDISPDGLHPNDDGHRLIGQLLTRYLDGVYGELDSIDTSDTAFTAAAYTADYYANAKMLGASEISPVEISGFELGGNSVYPELFPDNFVTRGEGYLKFETECKCLGFFYLKQTDGKGGKYDVYIDGERKGTLEADFSGGWGNYGDTKQIIISKDTEKHTVEIKLAEGSANTELTIFGIMQS